MRDGAAGAGLSDVEAKVHHVALADHVFLAFEPKFARLASAGLSASGEIVGEGDDFRTDEATLEVRVNDPGGLRRGGAGAHGPRTHLLGPRSEESLQSEQTVGCTDHAVESRLLELQFGEKLCAV